jgi:toxin ParE1/3/4
MAYRLAQDADADLDEIWRYVAEENDAPGVAQRLIEGITERFDTLSANPYMGRARHDLREGLRSHLVGNYLIFYRIIENDVLVLRILHGRRDIGSLFASADDDRS